jgi:hypothetical protein
MVTFAFAFFLKAMEFKNDLLGWANLPDWFELPSWLIPFANQGMACWVLCMIVCTVSALVTAPPAAENTANDLVFNWRNLWGSGGLRAAGGQWYTSVTMWWAISLLMMFGFVALFSVVL